MIGTFVLPLLLLLLLLPQNMVHAAAGSEGIIMPATPSAKVEDALIHGGGEEHDENSPHTINGIEYSSDDFHARAKEILGEEYEDHVHHIHHEVYEGEAAIAHRDQMRKEGKEHEIEEVGDEELTLDVIKRQLKEQGVSDGNLDKLANMIMEAHTDGLVEEVHKHEYDARDVDKMEGFKELVSQMEIRKEFKKIDADKDGRVYLTEVKEHFERELKKLNKDRVKKRIHEHAHPDDVTDTHVDELHGYMKTHYEEQLENIDTVWKDVDSNADGYISMSEYNKFVQESHWLAYQEKLARDLVGEDTHLLANWRDEL